VGTSYIDTGLTNGTAYYYAVSAAFSGNPNAGGESADSSEASATPQGAPPPTVTAPPGNLTAKATKPGTISLQWVQSNTTGVTQNSIYRRTSGGSYPSAPLAKINATTSYRDNSLLKHTTYCYVVTATATSGESVASNEACAMTK
jgi:fibronectin type 3 domain-containing protein